MLRREGQYDGAAHGHGKAGASAPDETNADQQIEKLEPNLGSRPNQAIWMPQVEQVRNPRLVKALKKFLSDQSVKIKEHTDVISLQVDNNQVCGIQTTNEFIQGDKKSLPGLKKEISNQVQFH